MDYFNHNFFLRGSLPEFSPPSYLFSMHPDPSQLGFQLEI